MTEASTASTTSSGPGATVDFPLADAIDAHYEGLARDELLITRCRECGRAQFPPRAVCYGCHARGTLVWERASGAATVWSYVIFHKAYFPPEVRETPYLVAVVELDEGPRLVTNVVDVADEEVHVGLRLQAGFRHDGEHDLVVFRPAPEPGSTPDRAVPDGTTSTPR